MLGLDEATSGFNCSQFIRSDPAEKKFLTSRLRIEKPPATCFHKRHGERPIVLTHHEDCARTIFGLLGDLFLDSCQCGKLFCDFSIACGFTGVDDVVAVRPENLSECS